jgi:hypothetical protein
MDKQPYPFDNQTSYNKVENAVDNVTRIIYSDSSKSEVLSVIQSSVTLLSVIETFNNGEATVLTIQRNVV